MGKDDIQQFKRGARLFQKIQPRLLPRHRGKIVAVEPESGKYVIGTDELDAARRAMAIFPNKIFDFFRVGYPTVHKFRRLKSRAARIR
ncbi:MAG: hypothetical protein HYZ73_03605 [Elusimicrobia bacterium]|nr:hypothetical protein [Elusimicrobiota bacterium]